MNPLDTNYTEAMLDATQRELAELKAISDQMAAALEGSRQLLEVYTEGNVEYPALDAFRTWEAKR